MGKKRRLFQLPILSALGRVAKFVLRTQLLTVWLVLGAVGFVVGMQARPESGTIPYEELFENMSVRSFRDAPSDTVSRFVVELAAGGRVFREYDVDAGKFTEPVRGHAYRRSISGTRYAALRVRGHVDRGFWLEMPTSDRAVLLPEQFEEMYRTTLDFVKPISIVTNALSILSGYSVGYRLAVWPRSLSAPEVQKRLVETPGIGPILEREAWKRILLEPVVTAQESDVARFAAASGAHRVYTNFFKLAVSDSNGFIPQEVARLDSAGCVSEARSMLAFAKASRCAIQDGCDLTSADFAAVEDWAGLIDRHGHWAHRSIPAIAAGRMQYLGTLAWYGVAPDVGDERRLWVGPRLIVRAGETEGFVADEIAWIPAACPVSWGAWLRGDELHPSGNEWTAQWLAESRQLAPLVKFCMDMGRHMRGNERGGEVPYPWEVADAAVNAPGTGAGIPPAVRPAAASAAAAVNTAPQPGGGQTRADRPAGESSDSLWSEIAGIGNARGADSARTATVVTARADSALVRGSAVTDSAAGGPAAAPTPESRVIRANMGGMGP